MKTINDLLLHIKTIPEETPFWSGLTGTAGELIFDEKDFQKLWDETVESKSSERKTVFYSSPENIAAFQEAIRQEAMSTMGIPVNKFGNKK